MLFFKIFLVISNLLWPFYTHLLFFLNISIIKFFFTCEENFLKNLTFCCYKCLRFVTCSKFIPCVCDLSSQCFKYLEKVTTSSPLALNLRNLFSTLFSCSKELGKQVTHTGKNLSHDKSGQLK